MRGLVLGALCVLGCAVSEPGEQADERLLLRCAGVLPESPVRFQYDADLVRHGSVWTAQEASGRVFATGDAAEGVGADGRVYVALDWRGADNGGEFEMSPLGATLRVQYWDTDGNIEWTYPGCFP